MSRVDKGADMSKVSPFLIKRSIDKEIGSVQECKKLRTGSLLIKCNISQAEKLKKITKLNREINVKCEQHQNFNTSKGKIFSRDLCYLTDEEIVEELSDQKVSYVRRMKKRDKETNKLTDEDLGIYILTFQSCQIPESIQIGYNKVYVEEFIPDPFRCYKCFRFGHSSEHCKEDTKQCPNCSCEAHCEADIQTGRFEKCTKSSKCVNCHKDHNSLFRKCEVFKKEKEIQCIRVKNRVSYFEARRRFKIANPLPVTFSRAAQNIAAPIQQEPPKSIVTIPKAGIPSTSGSKETDESVMIPNTKTINGKDGKELILIPRNTPKHKMDKIKGEQKKKQKYDGKLSSSHDESDF